VRARTPGGVLGLPPTGAVLERGGGHGRGGASGLPCKIVQLVQDSLRLLRLRLGWRCTLRLLPSLFTGVTEVHEVEPGVGEGALKEVGLVLHVPQPGLIRAASWTTSVIPRQRPALIPAPSSRTGSRRTRPAAVGPPLSGYLMPPAYGNGPAVTEACNPSLCGSLLTVGPSSWQTQRDSHIALTCGIQTLRD
jgi:hypothetical protein